LNLCDEGLFGFEEGVACGAGADREQVTVAEVIAEGGELPTQNHHVGRGESQREFFRRRVGLIG